MGFFTDTSICIGCKACEVACKEWNQLEGNKPQFLADSFDNTGQLDAQNWRHVQFVEQVPDNRGTLVQPTPIAGGQAWLMMSDVCKHCKNASCLEVCPTGAIMRTEFDTVFIQQDVCNGCRNCISACPYGVIGFNDQTGTARGSLRTSIVRRYRRHVSHASTRTCGNGPTSARIGSLPVSVSPQKAHVMRGYVQVVAQREHRSLRCGVTSASSVSPNTES